MYIAATINYTHPKAAAWRLGFGFSEPQARPEPSWSRQLGPAWLGLFGPGLARLTASGRARHSTKSDPMASSTSSITVTISRNLKFQYRFLTINASLLSVSAAMSTFRYLVFMPFDRWRSREWRRKLRSADANRHDRRAVVLVWNSRSISLSRCA